MLSIELHSFTSRSVAILLIAVLYGVIAKISFLFTIPPGNISPVFPAAGIALAAVLLLGRPALISVWLGSFVANTISFFDQTVMPTGAIISALVVGSCIGLGAMLSAGVGAQLVQRFSPHGDLLHSGWQVLNFIVLGALVGCLISPTVGVLSLAGGGYVSWEHVGYSWLTWWSGDAAGVILAAPLIVAWSQQPHLRSMPLRVVEATVLGGALLTMSAIVFGRNVSLEYMLIPLLLWSAFRFGMRGAATSAAVISLLAVVGTSQGTSPFVKASVNESLLYLQAFLSVATTTALMLAGVLAERHRAEQRERELQADNLRMSAELEVTRRLQQMLLPTIAELQQITDLDIACYMKPADEVGGDYYDILQYNGQIKIGIGDVTGHGLESGVVMLMTQTIVRALLLSGETDPERFLDTLNRTLYGNVQRMGTDKNLTLALLDYAAGEVRLSGQHEEMLVVRQDGTVERVETSDLGFPLGLVDEITDFIHHTTVWLQPGDGVVLYTDGITEAENMAGQQYGVGRLCTLVSQHWAASVEAIKESVVADVHQHIGAQRTYDDLTLVVMKRR